MKRKHFSVYFKLYERVKEIENHYRSMRGSSSGIAVSFDEYAIKFQSISIRKYLLECYMRNETPRKDFIDLELKYYRENKKKYEISKKPIDKES